MVARRESLAFRILNRIEAREFEVAEQLLGQFRALPSQDDLRRQIERRQQTMAPADEQLRRKIDTLFAETYRTVGQYLNPRRAQELQSELQQAREATDN
jgi:C-terminal processing protease CtpA/Prc